MPHWFLHAYLFMTEAKTPAEALEKVKQLYPNSTNAFFYVRRKDIAHPLRRYRGCMISGGDLSLVKSRCDLVDGVHHLKDEWL